MADDNDEIKVDNEELGDKKGKAAPAEAEIKIVDDPPAVDTPAADGKVTLSTDDGLKKLQKQLDDERTARIAAEARANAAAEGEAKALADRQTSQLDLVKNAIVQVTQANDALEGKYAEALAAQDFGGAAKINREMAANSARLAQLEAGKVRLENAPKPRPRPAEDPVEQFVADMSPRSAAWVRAHAEYVRDPKLNRKMIAAHELAIANDLKADTDEYFEAIEETLKLKKAPPKADPDPPVDDVDPTKDAAQAAAAPSRNAAPAAAPVSRSGNGTGNSRAGTITLTRAQAEAAAASGLTNAEYAKNLAVLKKEGRLN